MPQIDAPQRPQRTNGLFSVVGTIGPISGLTPLSFESPSCAGVQVRYPCDPLAPVKIIPPTVAPQGGFEPFWIVSGYQCKAFSNLDEYRQKALAALASVVERTVENELWASVLSPNLSTLPIVGVGADPMLRLAAALDYISQCGGSGGGILHMSAGTAIQLANEALFLDGDVIRTQFMNLPVTITSAPIGNSIAITGGITVELSEPTVIGGPESWIDRNTNETVVVAEQMAAVAFDHECCAGLVN